MQDDSQLLDLMLADQLGAPPIFKATNYWKNYVRVILPELRRRGLSGFRRREGSFLGSFGATDPGPHRRALLDNYIVNNHQTQRIPGLFAVVSWLDRLVTDTIAQRFLHAPMVYGLSPDEIQREVEQRAYMAVAALGKECGARPLDELLISLEGDPKYVFYVEGRPMTMSLLNYYIRYA